MSSEIVPSYPPDSAGYLPTGYAPNGWQQEQPAPEQPAGFQVGRIFAAIGRYKWLIVGLTVVGVASGYGFTRFLTPQYTASATVIMGVGGRGSATAGGPVPGDPIVAGPNWMGVLMSRSSLGAIVASRKLFVKPTQQADSTAFAGLDADDEAVVPGTYELRTNGATGRLTLVALPRKEGGPERVIQSGAIGDSVGRAIGLRWQPAGLEPSDTVRFTLMRPSMTANLVKSRLRTRAVPRTSILEITYTSPDRAEVVPVVNTLVNELVASAAEVQNRNIWQAADRLGRQADSVGRELRAAESMLETFKITTITEPTDAVPMTPGTGTSLMSPVMQDYFNKTLAHNNLKSERQRLEGILRDIRAGDVSTTAFSAVGSVNSSPELQEALKDLSVKEAQLRTARITYTDEHPAVRNVQRDLQVLRGEQIPLLTQQLIAELRKREALATADIGAAERRIRTIPTRTIEEQRLQREVAMRQSVYQTLMQSYQQTRVQALGNQRAITVLDSAVGTGRPEETQALIIILIACGAGLGLGLASAVVLDRIDPRFRYPEQATGELGLPIVGAVPTFRKEKNGSRDPDEASQIIEAFRTIRMNLRYAFDGAGSIAMAISSPGPGDGKSLVALNLALSFAEAGYRTLLIDGDIRRGELHAAFENPIVRRPGLMDHLVGTVPVESVFRETDIENLTLVPCGTRRHRGPELLQSQALNSFVDSMRTRFDAVIIDTPPLAAGIDPFVLGAATGHLLLVLRTGETDRKLAQSRLALAHRLPIRVLGAVLNDIEAEGAYRYYSYLYGYSVDDDEPQTHGRLVAKTGTGD
ncbi:MAG: polysaccharide biosynthesis tyrosine autokinase [Gemmatimonadota bacterium]|nr:polysaccharide biosynthesis tyrosine autokinase [Gemmatimonadota bacterium]